MGKLLFVNTNRVNGIVGLVASLVFAGLGAAATFTGSYFGLIGVALGLLLGKFCLKTATQRVELYEQGFVSKSIFASQSGRYSDLESITRAAVRVNGVVTTRIHLAAKSGERLMISKEALVKGDKESQLLMDRACSSLAGTWAKSLERNTEVVWLKKGSNPILKIRKDGVLVEGATGMDGLIPLNQMQMQSLPMGLNVDILNGDRRVITVNSGEANYFVGLALIAMILEKQTQSFAAGARG